MKVIGQLGRNDWLEDEEIREIFNLLDNQALFVGGCVRDSLLGKSVKDIDIATKITPEEVSNRLRASGIKVIPAGISFGMVIALTRNTNRAIEITTLRKDIHTDGRHAKVAFGTDWQEDALRRDFTINAFYADKEGFVYDPLDNYEDLFSGKIRFIGDPEKRIKEDALRILRFFRFYAYYGSEEIERKSIQAIKNNLFLLKKLSRERIKEEFFKIIAASRAADVLKIMEQTGVLDFISEDIHDISALSQLIWLETRGIVLPGLTVDITRRLATILTLTSENILYQKKKLRLSNEEEKRLLALSCCRDILKLLKTLGILKTIYLYGKENVLDSLLIEFSKHRSSSSYLSFSEDRLFIAFLEEVTNSSVPRFPIKGSELQELGFKGASIGKTLKILEKEWLDHNFSLDKKQLLEYALKKV